MDTERRTLRGTAAHSHVKLATGPLELANHCNSQPVLHHLTTFYIIRQTAQQTTHSHRNTPDHINYLSTAVRLTLIEVSQTQIPIAEELHKHVSSALVLFPLITFVLLILHAKLLLLSKPELVDGKKADKCNEILNLRAVQGAEVQQFVTISDRMSWPLQLKQ